MDVVGDDRIGTIEQYCNASSTRTKSQTDSWLKRAGGYVSTCAIRFLNKTYDSRVATSSLFRESDLTKLSEYDFELPRELIAQEPIQRRSDSRMMVVDRSSGEIRHAHVRDLPDFLFEGDALVLNDSKVIRARLFGRRTRTQGHWEGLFLRVDEQGTAELLSKTRGKIQDGEHISLIDNEGAYRFEIVVVGRTDSGNLLCRLTDAKDHVATETVDSWFELLERCGRVPLPPYIRDGRMVANDISRYQTVYAREPGSVAAPTAGLHFTEELIRHCRVAGQYVLTVTLHVGLGTFRPIQCEDIESHQMHSEWGRLTAPVCERLNEVKLGGGRIIAVGTTSLRVLESAALPCNGFPIAPWEDQTDIYVQPGFKFKCIDGLLTNFHLPKSSLLVLISALLGNELWKTCYDAAIEEEYRFFSYGDCMLIL